MPRAEIFSTFQMLAKIRRCHADVVTEKAAEMKFAGEIELAGNVLDGNRLSARGHAGARSRRLQQNTFYFHAAQAGLRPDFCPARPE
jgi:hypothetical protein